MSTMIPDLVVGEVGFGNNLAPEAEFYRAESGQLHLRIEELEAENRALIKLNNQLARALKQCAALSEEASNHKHEALLRYNEHTA